MALSDTMRDVLSKAPITGLFVDSPDEIIQSETRKLQLEKLRQENQKEGLLAAMNKMTPDKILNTGDMGKQAVETNYRKNFEGASSQPVQGPLTQDETTQLNTAKSAVPSFGQSTGLPESYGKVPIQQLDAFAKGASQLARAEKIVKNVLYDVKNRTIVATPGPGIYTIPEDKALQYMTEVSKEKYLQDQRLGSEERGQQRQIDAETRKNELIPPDKAGLYTLANESIGNIDDIRKILFPDGTPASFNRTAAALGSIGMFGGAPNSEIGQTLFRKMGASLAARQLIQTGVAARPEETQALYKQFASGIMSNPQAAFSALNELQNFYKNYNNTLKTKGAGEVAQPNINTSIPTPTPSNTPSQPITATNKANGLKIQSFDGGKTWQPVKTQ